MAHPPPRADMSAPHPSPFLPPLPAGWTTLREERERPYFRELEGYLSAEYDRHAVHPPREEVFRALELTPLRDVRVVLLGQDPYHGPGQAHGLAFSVRPGVPPPPSLRNLHRELHDDLDIPVPDHGSLEPWARAGVLLLNTALTVREGAAGSHAAAGWDRFTDAVLRRVAEGSDRVVFLLLGRHAQRKAAAVDLGAHGVIEAPHPSPLSAHRGFFGSRIFSRANDLLAGARREPVDWRLPAPPVR